MAGRALQPDAPVKVLPPQGADDKLRSGLSDSDEIQYSRELGRRHRIEAAAPRAPSWRLCVLLSGRSCWPLSQPSSFVGAC